MAASLNRFCLVRSRCNSIRISSRLIPCLLNCSSRRTKAEIPVYSLRRCYTIPSTKRSPSQSTDSASQNDERRENKDIPTDLDGFYPENTRFPVFDHMVKFRRKQAACSVVVQVSSSKSAAAAKDACTYFGEVENILHCSLPRKEILVVEFKSKDSVKKLKKSCHHTDGTNVIPSVSPFVWLRAGSICSKKMVEDETSISEESTKDMKCLLTTAKSISDQIGIYHSCTRISEVNQRLRWITCNHIEEVFSGLFPHIQVHPFGSSINGCGQNRSDVDMAMSFNGLSSCTNPSPIMFQAKASKYDGRAKIAKEMELIGNFLQHFATGFVISQKVLHARVPIVKFRQEMTELDCDLSLSSQTAIPMSELIYLFGEMDWRFRPLIFAVRLWAETSRLTRAVPGQTITNFSLTLLLVFFLQRLNQPVLPSLNEMIVAARPEDRRIVADVDCTFLRDPSVFSERARKNTQSLEELFVGFLQFLNKFQFSDFGISVITGRVAPKTSDDHQKNALHIQNPLDRELNVSKNVSKAETLRIAAEAHNALRRLESGCDQHWGILSFMEQTGASSLHKIVLRDILKIQEDPAEKKPAPAGHSPVRKASGGAEGGVERMVSRMQASISQKSEKKSPSKGGHKETKSKGT